MEDKIGAQIAGFVNWPFDSTREHVNTAAQFSGNSLSFLRQRSCPQGKHPLPLRSCIQFSMWTHQDSLYSCEKCSSTFNSCHGLPQVTITYNVNRLDLGKVPSELFHRSFALCSDMGCVQPEALLKEPLYLLAEDLMLLFSQLLVILQFHINVS